MDQLMYSPLFHSMISDEIQLCLACSNAKIVTYEKNEIIFDEGSVPRYLFILMDGEVQVCRNSMSGKQVILNSFHEAGEIFGEVFLFLPDMAYPNFTIAGKKSTILKIPKGFFFQTCDKGCGHHTKLNQNMLGILAQKAYYLNKKLQIVFGTNLRQRIVRYLLDQGDGKIFLNMSREQFAEYLGTTRPSLSRELMKMQQEGLIENDGRYIHLKKIEELEAYL